MNDPARRGFRDRSARRRGLIGGKQLDFPLRLEEVLQALAFRVTGKHRAVSSLGVVSVNTLHLPQDSLRAEEERTHGGSELSFNTASESRPEQNQPCLRSGVDLLARQTTIGASHSTARGVAQPGQSAAFGTQRSMVRIHSPRLLKAFQGNDLRLTGYETIDGRHEAETIGETIRDAGGPKSM